MQTKSISNNYIAIQGWMVEQLGLKGNELLAYALIHGFSQDQTSQFTGSIAYIQQWLNCARQTVFTTLQTLEKKGLLKKHEIHQNNQKYCTYQAIIPATITQSKNQTTQSKNPTPPVQKLDKTSPEIRPNNIYNIDNNITAPTPLTFDTLWRTYAKGNPIQSRQIYDQLPDTTKHLIHHHLHGDEYHEGYLQSTADDNHRYRLNFENYLTQSTYLRPLSPREISNIELV